MSKKLSKILIRTSLSQELIEQVNSLGTRKHIVQIMNSFVFGQTQHFSLSQLEAIIMITSTENVALFCGVPYFEFPVPAAYVIRQQKSKRKCTESRIKKLSPRLKSYQVVILQNPSTRTATPPNGYNQGVQNVRSWTQQQLYIAVILQLYIAVILQLYIAIILYKTMHVTCWAGYREYNNTNMTYNINC